MTKDHQPVSCIEPYGTESQNHSTAWAGKDLEDHRTVEPAASEGMVNRCLKPIQHGLERLHECGTHSSLGTASTVLCCWDEMRMSAPKRAHPPEHLWLESPCATTAGFALIHPPAPKRAPASAQPNPAQRGRISLNSLAAISIAVPAAPSGGVLQNR